MNAFANFSLGGSTVLIPMSSLYVETTNHLFILYAYMHFVPLQMCANFFHDVFDIQKYCILSSDESIIPMILHLVKRLKNVSILMLYK